jgi:hypothetical protein
VNEIPKIHKIPRIVRSLISCVVKNEGFSTEGVFRLSAGAGERETYREYLKTGNYDKLDEIKDCIVPAAIMKEWLRSISPLLIPNELYADVLAAGESKDPAMAVDVIRRIPPVPQATLIYLFHFFHELIQHKGVTKMGAVQLSVVLTPNLLRSTNPDPMAMMVNNKSENNFVEVLIENAPLLNSL